MLRALIVLAALSYLFVPKVAAADPLDAPTPGYHKEKRFELEYVGTGFLLFAATYTPTLAAATIGSSEAVKDCGALPRATCPNTLAPLFVPVVGPFWMIGSVPRSRRDDAVVVALVVDGMLQASGLVMIGYGLIPHAVLMRNATTSVAVGPMLGSGLGLTGTF